MERKLLEIGTEKCYWFFRAEITSSGRFNYYWSIKKVNLKKSLQNDNIFIIIDSTENRELFNLNNIYRDVFISSRNGYYFLDTKEEAIIEWNRLINNSIDKLSATYKQKIRNLESKKLKE